MTQSPQVPERLRRLPELANDLWWTWNARPRDVFRRLDYPLWRQTAHNPVLMLRQVSEELLEASARDERKSKLGDALYCLLTWTADLAAVSSGGEPRFHPEHADALRRLSSRVVKLSLFRYYQSLLRQRGLLGHPLQPRLVVEALLFEYRLLFTRGN